MLQEVCEREEGTKTRSESQEQKNGLDGIQFDEEKVDQQ